MKNNNLVILSAEKCPKCGEYWDVRFLRNGIHQKYFCRKRKKAKKLPIE